MKNILGIILIVAAVGMVAGAGVPLWNQIEQNRREQANLESVKNEINSVIEKKNQLLTRYRAISEADLDRVQKMVPLGSDREGTLLILNSVASRHNMKITSLRLTEDAEQRNTARKLAVALSVSGTYNDMLEFMNELEHAIRLTDVEQLTFTSTDTDKYTFTITATSYYLAR